MIAPANTASFIFWILNASLALVYGVELVAPGAGDNWNVALSLLAAASTLAAMARRLPLQNVLPAAGMVALMGSLVHGLSALPRVELPLGGLRFNPAAGARLGGVVPWIVPMLWIVAVFNGRGLAQWILRPWRVSDFYGYWLMGLTAVLATLFDAALEPYASQVKHLWDWRPTAYSTEGSGIPWLNFLAWPWVVVVMQLVIWPWFIRKQPGGPSIPEKHPVYIWLGALALFASGTARSSQWWAAGIDGAIAVVTLALAVRGMRWRPRHRQV